MLAKFYLPIPTHNSILLRKKQAPKPKEPEPFVRYYKGQKKNYDSNTAKAPWDGSSFESQARAEQNQSEYHKTFYSKPVNIRFYFPEKLKGGHKLSGSFITK